MTDDTPGAPLPTPSTLAELMTRQAQLRGWMERLDASADDVPTHVVDRVRADYESRLADLVAQLRAHEETVRADAVNLQDELQLAREEQERAHDELAEGRLRTRLGEWSTPEWEERRAQLERAAAGAAEREEELRVELERLEELLFEMTDDTPEPEPRLDDPSPAAFASEQEADVAFDLGDEADPGAEDLVADTRPRAGVRCPDCGYTNDSTAWYCGVCGVSLT